MIESWQHVPLCHAHIVGLACIIDTHAYESFMVVNHNAPISAKVGPVITHFMLNVLPLPLLLAIRLSALVYIDIVRTRS
jgi:hypothetical protein